MKSINNQTVTPSKETPSNNQVVNKVPSSSLIKGAAPSDGPSRSTRSRTLIKKNNQETSNAHVGHPSPSTSELTLTVQHSQQGLVHPAENSSGLSVQQIQKNADSKVHRSASKNKHPLPQKMTTRSSALARKQMLDQHKPDEDEQVSHKVLLGSGVSSKAKNQKSDQLQKSSQKQLPTKQVVPSNQYTQGDLKMQDLSQPLRLQKTKDEEMKSEENVEMQAYDESQQHQKNNDHDLPDDVNSRQQPSNNDNNHQLQKQQILHQQQPKKSLHMDPVITAFQDSASLEKSTQDKSQVQAHLMHSTHNMVFNNVSFDQTGDNTQQQQLQSNDFQIPTNSISTLHTQAKQEVSSLAQHQGAMLMNASNAQTNAPLIPNSLSQIISKFQTQRQQAIQAHKSMQSNANMAADFQDDKARKANGQGNVTAKDKIPTQGKAQGEKGGHKQNKPSIWEFNEEFVKEMSNLDDQYRAQQKQLLQEESKINPFSLVSEINIQQLGAGFNASNDTNQVVQSKTTGSFGGIKLEACQPENNSQSEKQDNGTQRNQKPDDLDMLDEQKQQSNSQNLQDPDTNQSLSKKDSNQDAKDDNQKVLPLQQTTKDPIKLSQRLNLPNASLPSNQQLFYPTNSIQQIQQQILLAQQQAAYMLDENVTHDCFEFQANSLQFFYPKQVQRHLNKKKFSNTESIVKGLKAPQTKAKFKKMKEKLNGLVHAQNNFLTVIFQKIDRKSKPIKKQEKIINDNLKRKGIFLEQENFDILSVLQQSQHAIPKMIQSNIEQISSQHKLNNTNSSNAQQSKETKQSTSQQQQSNQVNNNSKQNQGTKVSTQVKQAAQALSKDHQPSKAEDKALSNQAVKNKSASDRLPLEDLDPSSKQDHVLGSLNDQGEDHPRKLSQAEVQLMKHAAKGASQSQVQKSPCFNKSSDLNDNENEEVKPLQKKQASKVLGAAKPLQMQQNSSGITKPPQMRKPLEIQIPSSHHSSPDQIMQTTQPPNLFDTNQSYYPVGGQQTMQHQDLDMLKVTQMQSCEVPSKVHEQAAGSKKVQGNANNEGATGKAKKDNAGGNNKRKSKKKDQQQSQQQQAQIGQDGQEVSESANQQQVTKNKVVISKSPNINIQHRRNKEPMIQVDYLEETQYHSSHMTLQHNHPTDPSVVQGIHMIQGVINPSQHNQQKMGGMYPGVSQHPNLHGQDAGTGAHTANNYPEYINMNNEEDNDCSYNTMMLDDDITNHNNKQLQMQQQQALAQAHQHHPMQYPQHPAYMMGHPQYMHSYGGQMGRRAMYGMAQSQHQQVSADINTSGAQSQHQNGSQNQHNNGSNAQGQASQANTNCDIDSHMTMMQHQPQMSSSGGGHPIYGGYYMGGNQGQCQHPHHQGGAPGGKPSFQSQMSTHQNSEIAQIPHHHGHHGASIDDKNHPSSQAQSYMKKEPEVVIEKPMNKVMESLVDKNMDLPVANDATSYLDQKKMEIQLHSQQQMEEEMIAQQAAIPYTRHMIQTPISEFCFDGLPPNHPSRHQPPPTNRHFNTYAHVNNFFPVAPSPTSTQHHAHPSQSNHLMHAAIQHSYIPQHPGGDQAKHGPSSQQHSSFVNPQSVRHITSQGNISLPASTPFHSQQIQH